MSVPCEQKGSIDKILDRVGSLEQSQVRTDTLIETFTETSKELSSTLKHVEKTMIKIQNTSENTDKEVSSIRLEIVDIKKNEEKYKIDPREILKSIILKGAVGLLGAYGVYEAVIKIVGD